MATMFDPPRHHFHESAKEIRLEGWTLWASLRSRGGSWKVAQLRLGHVLGNNNGTFEWMGRNVNETAKDPTLVFWDGYPIIRASLRDNDGNYHQDDYNLSDKIGNSGGHFSFQYKGEVLLTTDDPDVFHGMGELTQFMGELRSIDSK
ncbi:hypothetical protein N7451_010733 [Penicillium sp. IBT 35674x]|nr:hypothetical protein N7451_010733 [Penicillium sp. IBT 35674x]